MIITNIFKRSKLSQVFFLMAENLTNYVQANIPGGQSIAITSQESILLSLPSIFTENREEQSQGSWS